jgi:hypothetical protein
VITTKNYHLRSAPAAARQDAYTDSAFASLSHGPLVMPSHTFTRHTLHTARCILHTTVCSTQLRTPSPLTQALPLTTLLPPRRLLANASRPDRTAGEDVCNRPPFACDKQGRLLRFPGYHAGFNCQGNVQPWATFSQLEHLDLGSNAIGASTQAVAALVAKLPSLKKLSLPFARISGPMTCDLIGTSMKVRRGSSTCTARPLTLPLQRSACGAPPQCMEHRLHRHPHQQHHRLGAAAARQRRSATARHAPPCPTMPSLTAPPPCRCCPCRPTS